MIQNKLKINDSVTEFLALTSSFLKQHFNYLNISVRNSRIAPSISARNLGVILNHRNNAAIHYCMNNYVITKCSPKSNHDLNRIIDNLCIKKKLNC